MTMKTCKTVIMHTGNLKFSKLSCKMQNNYQYYTKYNTGIILGTFGSWVDCNEPVILSTVNLGPFNLS